MTQPVAEKVKAARDREMDIEATAFALELLVPLKLLRKELSKHDSMPTARALAEIFQVPEDVMSLRLLRFRG